MKTNKTDVITSYASIPYNIIKQEITGTSKAEFLTELGKIKKLYEVYTKGSDFTTEGTNGEYVPAQLRYKKAKTILDKEARFLFSSSPDYTISVPTKDGKIDKDSSSVLQLFIDDVLKDNQFNLKLLKASKDCFIGKRVACLLNFNDDGIKISFVNALEFLYETDPIDVDYLTKLVIFPKIHTSSSATETRIFKKKYIMDKGLCYVEEIVYDGNGKEVEVITEYQATNFPYIPAKIIVNDGLIGDVSGESEIELLEEYESWYSKLANADKDAERKSMNPTNYAIDCDPSTTQRLSSAAGAFWDLSSDENQSSDRQGQVGILEPAMSYSASLKTTLDRINNTMHEQLDVPNINSESLQGAMTSGKTLKAIYWGLIVRCDEKMLTWRPALELVLRTIVDGALLYPNSALKYTEDKVPDVFFRVEVENNYPLPEDEAEEKAIDLSEVSSLTMSKKAYMKKWRRLTDDEADEELRQIALERELLEDSFGVMPPTDENKDDNEDDDNVNRR